MTKKHKKMRLYFCNDIKKRKNIFKATRLLVFSDETLFKLYGKTNTNYTFTYRGVPPPELKFTKMSKSVIVWGMISYLNKFRLVIVTGP